MSKKTTAVSCPCGSGRAFDDCCGPCISGELPAPSAGALMRSRYTAYAMRDEHYLLDSWHPSTRPNSIKPDPAVQWIRLEILNCERDQVEFIATCRFNGKAHKLHEISRFVIEDGKWYYVDGIILE